jgi:uncharacterized protein
MLLPDVNVWLALAFEQHAAHDAANHWFEQVGEESLGFCRLTQQGFLRLATNRSAVGTEVVSLDAAWTLYDSILADDRIAFVTEPSDLETYWRAYSSGGTFSNKVWSDAYLAAFASASRMRLVTNDRGFSRYRDLDWHLIGNPTTPL